MRLRTPVLAGCVAGLLAFGGACSDDGDQSTDDTSGAVPEDGVPPDEWVAALCAALDDWLSSLEAETESLQDDLEGLRDDATARTGATGGGRLRGGVDTGRTGAVDGELELARDRLAEYLDEAIASTETLVEELDEAGVPETPDGEGVAATFRDAFDDALDTFVDARTQVDDVPTDDLSGFERAVTEIGDDIDVAAERIQASFDEAEEEFDVEELDEAFDDEEACARLS